MSQGKIGKENVGRIAERIVANELEYHGYHVRDLNLEGLAANVDLLAIKDGKVWLVQVKGSSYDTTYPNNGWWFQYGYCTEEHLRSSQAKMFNRKPGSFQAGVAALLCVKSPHEYQCIFLPIKVAERAAQVNINSSLRTKKADGSDHKPGKVWFSLYDMNARTEEKRAGVKLEQELVRPFLIDRSRSAALEGQRPAESEAFGILSKVFADPDATFAADSLVD